MQTLQTEAHTTTTIRSDAEDFIERPPQPTSYGKWEWIDPHKAEELLACMVRQRRLIGRHVADLGRQMKSGLWKQNPEPIMVNTKGETDEGQHRLRAIIESDRPQWMFVIRNVADDVSDVINVGRPRRGSDVVSMRYRDANATTLAAAAGWLWRYRNDSLLSLNVRLSPQEIRMVVDENRRLALLTEQPKELRQLLGGGPATFLRFIFSERDDAESARFFDLVISGDGPRGSGARELRERLQKNLGMRRRMVALEKIAISFKAFNYHRTGRSFKILGWKKTDPFPELER